MAYEADLNPNRKLSSIFFGGGTPSLMPPKLVEKLISQAQIFWGFENDIEITLEANPSSVEAKRFSDLSLAGINRVSLGLQSLDDQTLEFLGRAHSVKEGLTALDIAQKNFARTSFDLIYARPNQSTENWESELERALSFGSDHLSLYQLTIEPSTRFETLVRTGDLIPADDDTCADLFALTRDITRAAGIPAYEISNHARSGQQSRHNLIYWRYQDYIGIGPGAHGRRKGSDMEAMMMGLRLNEGIDLLKISAKTNIESNKIIDQKALHNLSNLGFATHQDHRVIVTEKGMPLLDTILPQLINIEAGA